jgi:hypothetical protein
MPGRVAKGRPAFVNGANVPRLQEGCFSFLAARKFAAALSFSHMYAPLFVFP